MNELAENLSINDKFMRRVGTFFSIFELQDVIDNSKSSKFAFVCGQKIIHLISEKQNYYQSITYEKIFENVISFDYSGIKKNAKLNSSTLIFAIAQKVHE